MGEEDFIKINIQWFPGHMTKAERMIEDNIKMVDAVCEVLDARIPKASHNPDVDRLTSDKPRLVVLNRTDLADPSITAEWVKYYIDKGYSVLQTDAKSGKGVKGFPDAIRVLLKDKIAGYEAKGQVGRNIRVMILGIPNVGKSSLINRLSGRKATEAGDRPGVTRGKQWVSAGMGIDILDTPGILWPRFEDQSVGELLAVTNAIKPEVVDREALASNFLVRMRTLYPEVLISRYKIDNLDGLAGYQLLEAAAKKRGYLVSKGEYDTERMANTILKEFHDGLLGRMTLEVPNNESVGL